jgi:hypothetical protein
LISFIAGKMAKSPRPNQTTTASASRTFVESGILAAIVGWPAPTAGFGDSSHETEQVESLMIEKRIRRRMKGGVEIV